MPKLQRYLSTYKIDVISFGWYAFPSHFVVKFQSILWPHQLLVPFQIPCSIRYIPFCIQYVPFHYIFRSVPCSIFRSVDWSILNSMFNVIICSNYSSVPFHIPFRCMFHSIPGFSDDRKWGGFRKWIALIIRMSNRIKCAGQYSRLSCFTTSFTYSLNFSSCNFNATISWFYTSC